MHSFWSHSFMGGARSRFGHRPHGRPHGFWAELVAEPPPRAERGGVRYLVLDAIADRPRHGYEVIQVIGERTAGSYKPSPGVVYPTLQMLEELGHAKVSEQEGRKVYSITEAGKQDLADNRELVEDFYERSTEGDLEDYAEELADLGKRVARLFKGFRRAGRRGRLSPSTMKKLKSVLDEALAKIEAIVEGEERR